VTDYQRAFYDAHFAKRAGAVRDQLAHPLFRSFNDRVAELVLASGPPPRSQGRSGPPPRSQGRSGPAEGRVRVYEPGCGEGLVAAALARVAARRGVELVYTGADLSGAALDLAATSVPGADLRVGDAAEVTAALEPASQDVVVAKNLLHHLPDPAAFLRSAARALAPGGRVVAFEPRLGCPQFLLFNVLAPRRERHYFEGQRRNRAAFDAAGYRVLRRQRFGWLPYELAFVIRPAVFRRLFSTGDPATIARVSALDDRLTAAVPALACYEVWVGQPA
jgi:SAM-dependent methyltransferase